MISRIMQTLAAVGRLQFSFKKQSVLLRREGEALGFLDASGMDGLTGAGNNGADKIRQRCSSLLFLTIALYTMLPLRIIYLVLIKPDGEESGAVLSADSGPDIVDRNGMLLATRLPVTDLVVEPQRLLDRTQAVNSLITVFPELNRESLLDKLNDTDKRYVIIKRNITPDKQQALHDTGLPGFVFEKRMRRFYPQGASTAHLIGYTDSDNKGIAGFERTLATRPALTGPARLTIDMNVQYAVYDVLRQAVENKNAQGAVGILMQASDGAVNAIVSLPDFDPNYRKFRTGDKARFNRAVSGVYEMGSTFKIFNTAIALETGVVKPTDKFDVTGPYYVYGRPITDYHPHRGFLSVTDIFRKSSNIGSAKMAEQIGIKAQQDYLGRLGLLSKPYFQLPETAAPLTPARWGPVESLTISYGYGLSVTPLQLITAVAGVVNGGIAVHPTLLERDSRLPRSDGQRIFSPETALAMRKMMRSVIEPGGTGTKAEVSGYPVIGKTGTANKIKAGGRHYDGSDCVASFVGAFPYRQPEYVLLVMIDGAKVPGFEKKCPTGGLVAAPVAHDIIERAAPLLGLLPENTPATIDTDAAPREEVGLAGEDDAAAGEN